MNEAQADKMKKDLCDSVDALAKFSQAPLGRMEQLAVGAVAMYAARFCAGVIVLAKGDQNSMSEIVQEERLWRLMVEADGLIDADEGDDEAMMGPERN